jgi:hypothetical protein
MKTTKWKSSIYAEHVTRKLFVLFNNMETSEPTDVTLIKHRR